jgi:hypothetical protein
MRVNAGVQKLRVHSFVIQKTARALVADMRDHKGNEDFRALPTTDPLALRRWRHL